MPSSSEEEEEDPNRSGYFAFFSASHFLFLLSSSSKFQFEFEGSVKGATPVILEGQYRAPCPCSLHVIQIICASILLNDEELEMRMSSRSYSDWDVTSSFVQGPRRDSDISRFWTRVRTFKHVGMSRAHARKTHFSYWALWTPAKNSEPNFAEMSLPAPCE